MVDDRRERVEAVLDRVGDEAGLERFLSQHPQFGKPKRFWFISSDRPGRVYPTKPVVAVALGWPDVNGGYSQRDSACNVLERAGYTITDERGVPISGSSELKSELERRVAAISRTEVDAIVRRRVGQDIFRDLLMDYWNGRCAVSGITDPDLLRASHIKPWSECDSDHDRLNPHNGLLLSALWDAAFDKGLISFAANGRVLASDRLSSDAKSELSFNDAKDLWLDQEQLPWLAWHRRRHGFPQ